MLVPAVAGEVLASFVVISVANKFASKQQPGRALYLRIKLAAKRGAPDTHHPRALID